MKRKLQVALLRGGWNELMIAGFSHRSTGIPNGLLIKMTMMMIMVKMMMIMFPKNTPNQSFTSLNRDSACKWSDRDSWERSHIGRWRDSGQVQRRRLRKQLDLPVLQSAGWAGDEDAGDDDGQDRAGLPQVWQYNDSGFNFLDKILSTSQLPQGHRPFQPWCQGAQRDFKVHATCICFAFSSSPIITSRAQSILVASVVSSPL